MKLSKIIIEKLLNDQKFRLNACLALDMGERNLQERAKKNVDNSSLTKMAAITFFKSEGFTEEQIFEQQEASV